MRIEGCIFCPAVVDWSTKDKQGGAKTLLALRGDPGACAYLYFMEEWNHV